MSSEALKKAQEKLAEMRALGISPVILNPIEKSKREPKSLRLAITALCYDCVGAEMADNYRQEVKNCTVKRCPVYHVRPWQEVK